MINGRTTALRRPMAHPGAPAILGVFGWMRPLVGSKFCADELTLSEIPACAASAQRRQRLSAVSGTLVHRLEGGEKVWRSKTPLPHKSPFTHFFSRGPEIFGRKSQNGRKTPPASK